jgi:2',3'-cyclic-nucleotide 2'-phosphodiesterase (5'-nucleotidase family)
VLLLPFIFTKNMQINKYFIGGLFIAIAACKTVTTNSKVEYMGYKIEKAGKQDSALQSFLNPYKDSISGSMNKVLAFSLNAMYKKQPESALGNLMCDAMRIMATEKFGVQIDAAFINYGGIRSYLPKGNITVGNVYEIMPFDNMIVVQQLTGKQVKDFLDYVASRGGWPISGITMQISNKQAINITIGGESLQQDKVYHIANSDYVARGGDDAFMLKKITLIDKGFLVRDAIITYLSRLNALGNPLDLKLENRITNATN